MHLKHSICIVFIVVCCIAQNACAQQQPNILLVILDDIGVGEIPRYEPMASNKAKMPNLEVLMNEGVTFDNVWSNPVCAPSRANILTGKHGLRTNVLNASSLANLSLSETSLHTYIDDVSGGTYANSLIGKWHLGGNGTNGNLSYPNDLGISYFAGIMSGGVQDYERYQLVENGEQNMETTYITSKFSDLAIEWIRAQDQPWFCWLAYNAAHTPLHLPPLDLHSSDNLSPTQDAIDADPQAYFLAMIESVDTEMGRVIESIPSDELDNTVIIVIGDNGTARGVVQAPYERNQAKGSVFQGGVHVPMVISGAGVTRAGENEQALVSFSDLFTTIVEMTGSDLNQLHDSYSFYDLLSRQGEGQRTCMYTEVGDDDGNITWATRDTEYKYISMDDGTEHFYNLLVDPYETTNLLPALTTDERTAYEQLTQCKANLVSVDIEPVLTKGLFQLYPNPAKNEITISALNGHITTSYQIINELGQVVLQGNIEDFQNIININELLSGKYFIQIAGEQKGFIKL